MTPIVLGGTWIDVAGDVVAHALGSNLIVNRVLADGSLQLIWAVTCEEPPMFHRLAVSPNGVAAVFAKGNVTGQALIILQSGVIPIGTTHGNNPGAIYWDGESFVAEWVETPGVFAVWRSSDGHVSRFPIPEPWTNTATGILDIMPDGYPLLMDSYRVYQQPPWSFTKPNVRDGVRVGQWGRPGNDHSEDRIIVGLPSAGNPVFTGLRGTFDDPRLSVQPSGRLIVAAFGLRGATLQIIDPPYPPAEQPPIGPFVPPPVPPQPPTPEPPPMATVPNRASQLTDFWQRWNGSRPITDEAEKHRFTAAFMAELNTLDGSGRWGRKARPGTNAVSKDTAGYWLGTAIPTSPTDGKIHAFDLISGGDGSVHWDKAAEQGDTLYNNIDARWFPVTAAAPAPGPTPPPQPGPDLTSRVAELERLRVEDRQAAKDALQAVSDALQREIDAISPSRDPAALRAAVEAILSGYEVNGNTSRTLAHGHTVRLPIVRKP